MHISWGACIIIFWDFIQRFSGYAYRISCYSLLEFLSKFIQSFAEIIIKKISRMLFQQFFRGAVRWMHKFFPGFLSDMSKFFSVYLPKILSTFLRVSHSKKFSGCFPHFSGYYLHEIVLIISEKFLENIFKYAGTNGWRDPERSTQDLGRISGRDSIKNSMKNCSRNPRNNSCTNCTERNPGGSPEKNIDIHYTRGIQRETQKQFVTTSEKHSMRNFCRHPGISPMKVSLGRIFRSLDKCQ